MRAVLIFCTQLAPPISATKRPPGRRAFFTPEITASGLLRIQWRAALLKTASNSFSK